MKKTTQVLMIVILSIILSSCAKEKELSVKGNIINCQPYGWANSDAEKVDGVVYEVSCGNVIWSAILCETIFIPVWITGWYLFEPVRAQ